MGFGETGDSADKGKIINKDVKDDIGGPPSMLWGGVEWNGV